MTHRSSLRRQFGSGSTRLNSRTPVLVAAAAVAFGGLTSSPLNAAALAWDPLAGPSGTSTAPTGAGGTGNWDLTDLFWSNGTTDVAWAQGDAAVFGGTAGTVTMTTAITSYGETFNTGGYAVATGANTLTMGVGGIVTTNTAGTTGISGTLAANAAEVWSVAAGGTLQLDANFSSGSTYVFQLNSAGTTNITGTFGVAGKTTLSGGGTFNLSGTETLATANGDYDGIANTTVNVTGGSATFAGANAFFIGNGGAGTTSTLNITGGTATQSTNIALRIGNSYNGSSGTNTGTGTLTVGGGTGVGTFTTGTTTGGIVLGFTGSTGAVNLLTNGVFATNRPFSAGATAAGSITFNGGTLQATGMSLAIPTTVITTIADNGGTIDPQANPITIAANIGHGGTATTDGGLTIKAGTGNVALTGVLSFTGGLTYNAGGTISGNNTFTGATAINAFVDAKTSGNVFGATGTGNGTTINAGGTVRWRDTANTAIPEAMTFNGGTFYTYNAGGTTTLSGPLTLNTNTTLSVSPQAQGNTTLALSGGISDGTTTGNSLTLSRIGNAAAASNDVVNITGASTYGGATFITDALNTNTGNFSVKLSGGDNRLPTGTSVTLGGTSGGGAAAGSGRLILGDATTGAVSQMLAGLVTSGTGTKNAVVGANTTASTLNLNIASSDTYAGLLGGTGTNENSLALRKLGAGSLTLSGADTYVGGTTISAGTLITANTSALGAGSVNVTGGGLTLGNGTVDTVTGVTGLTLSSGTTLKLAATDSNLALASGTFTLGNINLDLNNAFNSVGTYTVLSGISSADTIGATTFLNADTTDYAYSFAVSGNNGVLSVSSIAVPEPASLGLLALGGMGMIRRRRRS